MVRFLRLLFVVLALGLSVPAIGGETVAQLTPTGYVNDFAGVLSPDTVQSLDQLCGQVDREAHAQIAVVTIKTIDPDKSGATPSIEEFSTDLEDKWKVGQKGTDRGVLMIFVMNPPPPHGRIEVGYGLEGILNDAKVGDIGREMKPILQTGDYNQAVTLGVREIAQDIAADAGVTLAQNPGGSPGYHYETQPQAQVSPVALFVVGGIIVLVLGILIATGHIGLLFYLLFNLLGGGRGGGGGGYGGGGFGGGNDDSGGGFGGFGGGSSGGGGADF